MASVAAATFLAGGSSALKPKSLHQVHGDQEHGSRLRRSRSRFPPCIPLSLSCSAPTLVSTSLSTSAIVAAAVIGIPDYSAPTATSPNKAHKRQGPADFSKSNSASSSPSTSTTSIKWWEYSTSASSASYSSPTRKSYGAPSLYSAPSAYGPGGGNGDGGEGGGGRGGGGGDGQGGGNDPPKKKKLSMSQIVTLVFAATVTLGGLMGLVKKGSTKSFLVGAGTGAVLLSVAALLPSNPVLASSIGLGVSAALLAVMGSRFAQSKKLMPTGLVAALSLIMSAGYVHGILRSIGSS